MHRYLAETCNVKVSYIIIIKVSLYIAVAVLQSCVQIQVIVTNQIVTKLPVPHGEASEVVDGDRGVITSALGNAWYHSVNTRLLLGHGAREGRYREARTSYKCINNNNELWPRQL